MNELQDVGVVGIFMLLVLRQVLDFAAAKKNGNGFSPGKYAAAEEFLHELQEIRKDTTKIRENNHEHAAQLQTLAGKTDLILRHVERHR